MNFRISLCGSVRNPIVILTGIVSILLGFALAAHPCSIALPPCIAELLGGTGCTHQLQFTPSHPPVDDSSELLLSRSPAFLVVKAASCNSQASSYWN